MFIIQNYYEEISRFFSHAINNNHYERKRGVFLKLIC